MKRENKKINLLLGILIAIILILFLYFDSQLVGYIVKEPAKYVEFYFYDEKTRCPLNGYVFAGDKAVGKTYEGRFNLSYGNYIQNFQNKEEISLFGKLGNCFGSELLFDKYWENLEIDKEYFLGNSVFEFKTEINKNNPSRRELLGFIQPDSTEAELEKINTRENTLDSLSEINNYLNKKITYVWDWEFEGENYWQTPAETLEKKEGDCEDYSSTLLSLFFAYDSSLDCYNVVLTSHVTTFCRIGDYYVYYDQGKTELKKRIADADKKPALERLNEEYFRHYGLNETKVHYAFNGNSFIEFKGEEFVEWQSLMKKQGDIFENIEFQLRENMKDIPDAEIEGELHTQTLSLPSEKLNLSLIVLLAGILIVLIAILIVVNKRK